MNRLSEILLNKSLNECSEEELQLIIQRYPYFNAGHLLAVQKLQNESPGQLSESLQKANLHFQSLYIDQILSGKGNAEIIPGSNVFSTPATEIPESITTESKSVNAEQINIVSEESNQVTQEHPVLNTQSIEETQITVVQDSLKTEEQTADSNGKQDTEFDQIQSSHNDELIIKHEQSDTNEQYQQPDIQNPVPNNQEQEPRIQQPVSSNEPLTFEPYHTVDYFASQGIKVKLDENPTDKFSKQLKSFTEWLKTLKKIPAENAAPIPAPTEQKVDQLAETSLTDSNVVTEAMAEVWAKQGNHEKAIEIYNKLSLLEPSKSTYFASLIEDLKKASL